MGKRTWRKRVDNKEQWNTIEIRRGEDRENLMEGKTNFYFLDLIYLKNETVCGYFLFSINVFILFSIFAGMMGC